MSVVFVSGSSLYRTGNQRPNLSAFTEMMWIYPATFHASDNSIITYRNDIDVDSQWIELAISSAGALFTDTQSTSATGPTITLGRWTHVALVRSPAAINVFVDGRQVIALADSAANNAINSWDLAGLSKAAGPDSRFWFDGRLALYRVWSDAIFNQAQIQAEMFSPTPVFPGCFWELPLRKEESAQFDMVRGVRFNRDPGLTTGPDPPNIAYEYGAPSVFLPLKTTAAPPPATGNLLLRRRRMAMIGGAL